MEERNLGFCLDPQLMRFLAERNIEADIYIDDFDPPLGKRSAPTLHQRKTKPAA